MQSWQSAGSGRWVLGPEKYLRKTFDLETGRELGERHGEDWWLLPPGSARPTGRPLDEPVFRFVPAHAK